MHSLVVSKGRIERSFQTAQDRLVKGLRRVGAKDLETANAHLEQVLCRCGISGLVASRSWRGMPTVERDLSPTDRPLAEAEGSSPHNQTRINDLPTTTPARKRLLEGGMNLALPVAPFSSHLVPK